LTVPALHIGGWYDIFLSGTLPITGMRAQGAAQEARQGRNCLYGPLAIPVPQRSLASPGTTTSVWVRPHRPSILDGLLLRWVRLLAQGMDKGIMHEPPVRIFDHGGQRLAG